MTISAMRKDINIRHEKKYKESPSKKTRFLIGKNNVPIKNKSPKLFVEDPNTKIKNVQNLTAKASNLKLEKQSKRTKSRMSTQVRKTLNDTNIAVQIQNPEIDYNNVRIFVLKYFLDHNRDLNNEATLRILDKTIHKILKHFNEQQ